MRTTYWGYAPNEHYKVDELFKVPFVGIRPAAGYPSLPDQLLNHSLNELLDFSQIGIQLTENGAMNPTASISGLYIAHPESRYFMVGHIDQEQLSDYAQRRHLPLDAARKVLIKNIN